ncbi:MAG TPA: 2-dehydropantoate 2-reductase N-terminal domain-containing protein, partial [Lachnospiraceae bacterium]|nr:2-dehydropantoate 2-reductase N-terminal domain-containing protein [Lachnospiraceae bacterium]
MAKVGIIGAGSWGTAIGVLLTNNGHEVTMWSAIGSEIDMLNETHEHKDKLPGVVLSEKMTFTKNLKEAVEAKDLLVLAVPSVFTRQTAKQMKEYVANGQIIVNVAKGMEETTLMTLSEIVEEEIPQAMVTVLSGPSHAEEVGKGIPTTIVVGAKKRAIAEFVQEIFTSKVFRVYISPDV